MLKIPKIPFTGPVAEEPDMFICDDYTVTVNERDCEVRSCTVSAMPFNRVWPGKQRSIDQTETASFITFSADEAVTLKVKCRRDFSIATVRPLSKNVKIERNGDELIFTLKETGGYVLELDDEHFALHIFFNELKEYADKENATYYFDAGVHFPGVITLKDNESVYVDEEAIVFGSIYSTGADNIHIYGGGVIDGGCEKRMFATGHLEYVKGNIKLCNSHNVTIEDVILKDSATWVLSLFECDNVTIDNVKIVGQWRYNTDGVDVVNTSNVTIKNSFIRAFDDVITIKGQSDKVTAIENILTDNCVLWCGWGRTCEIGIETASNEYRNITFRNCDLIHNSASALDIQNGDYADIHDLLFENLNVEYQKSTLPEIFQDSDEQIYDAEGRIGVPYLIFSDNHKYYCYHYASDEQRLKNQKFSDIHDIVYRNINVSLEEGVPAPKIRIASLDDNVVHRNFTIDGLYLNGEKVTDFDRFDVEISNVENVILK